MGTNIEPSGARPVGRGRPDTHLDAFERVQARFNDTLTALGHELERWSNAVADGPALTPPADIEETDDAYFVEMELAGIKRGDIDITATGRTLTIVAERREKERVGILRKRTRTVGTVRCEFELPGDIEPDHVEAGLEHGVLTVKLPKPERARARRIEIT